MLWTHLTKNCADTDHAVRYNDWDPSRRSDLLYNNDAQLRNIPFIQGQPRIHKVPHGRHNLDSDARIPRNLEQGPQTHQLQSLLLIQSANCANPARNRPLNTDSTSSQWLR